MASQISLQTFRYQGQSPLSGSHPSGEMRHEIFTHSLLQYGDDAGGWT